MAGLRDIQGTGAMTSLSPEARAKRLLHIFNRTGGEGQWTRPYEAFSPDVRAALLARASMAPKEFPVLASFQDNEHWALITTEQVVVCRPGSLQCLAWSEVETATMDPDYVSAVLSQGQAGKLALCRLEIVRHGGGVVEVDLEPGPAFFGFLNVLKGIANMRKGAS